MATHASEIINEADISEISIVESKYRTNRRVKNEEEYPEILQYIGSSENAIFARLAKAKRVLFVEGNDSKLLRKFGGKLGLAALTQTDSLSIIKLNGFSQWRRAVDSVWAFKNIAKLDIKAFCLFDRDYRTDAEVEDFIEEMKGNDVICRILGRKEIENYLLEISVLDRAIKKRIKLGFIPASAVDLLLEATEPLKSHVSSQQMANEIQSAEKRRRSLNRSTLIKGFTENFEENWSKIDFRIKVCSGKEILSNFNIILQERYKISLSHSFLCGCFKADELSSDLVNILHEFENFSKS